MGRSFATVGKAIRIALGLFLCLCAGARAADEFNDQRLDEGRMAYQQKSYVEAMDQFRIAAFGFLDRPEKVSECLARLALAEAGAGQKARVEETLGRFLDVERRFSAYAKASLEPEVRADFQALLLRVMPAGTVAGVPSLSSLVESDEQKIARLPSAERRKALRAAAKREPGAVRWPLALAREALERGDTAEATRWVDKALALDPANEEARTLQASLERPPAAKAQPATATVANPSPARGASKAGDVKAPASETRPAPAPDSRQVLEESHRLISAGRAGTAVPLLNSALAADPGNRELRLALLEAACLARSYDVAIAQLPLSTPFSDSEASSMFYAAVVLFETGRNADARSYLQRALPRVTGPLVDEYSKKIMGSVQ